MADNESERQNDSEKQIPEPKKKEDMMVNGSKRRLENMESRERYF